MKGRGLQRDLYNLWEEGKEGHTWHILMEPAPNTVCCSRSDKLHPQFYKQAAVAYIVPNRHTYKIFFLWDCYPKKLPFSLFKKAMIIYSLVGTRERKKKKKSRATSNWSSGPRCIRRHRITWIGRDLRESSSIPMLFSWAAPTTGSITCLDVWGLFRLRDRTSLSFRRFFLAHSFSSWSVPLKTKPAFGGTNYFPPPVYHYLQTCWGAFCPLRW